MTAANFIKNSLYQQLSILRLLACFIVLVGSSKLSFASISGDAYWGSFGEGAGRIECVVFKSEGGSQFIGYDEETKAGFFSTSVLWDAETDFSFEGVTIKNDSAVAGSGSGLVSTILSSSEIKPVLLEGSIDEETLNFQAFASGEAVYHQFDLIGHERSTLKVVIGENGLVYALFTDSEGIAYGGEAEFNETTEKGAFITPEGNRFDFDVSSLGGSFVLASGAEGGLADVATEEEPELEDTWVDQIWMSESKLSERGSSAIHFILEGEGRATIDIDALVSVVEANPTWLLSSDVTVALYKLTPAGAYEKLFDSATFYRVKLSNYSLMDLEGSLSCEAGAGTYLVQVSGDYDARSVNEVTIAFDSVSQKNGLRVVNMSTLYIAGQLEAERTIGFSLGGDGVSKAVVRNVGPSLSQFDLPSNTLDPKMAISRDSVKSWKNDDWGQSSSPSQLSDTMRSLGAFELGENSKDAALKLTLQAGSYDIAPQGTQKDSAYELIEVYFDGEN